MNDNPWNNGLNYDCLNYDIPWVILLICINDISIQLVAMILNPRRFFGVFRVRFFDQSTVHVHVQSGANDTGRTFYRTYGYLPKFNIAPEKLPSQ